MPKGRVLALRKPGNALDFDRPREWEVIISPTAFRRLKRISSDIAQDILDKIEWLRNDADSIKHSRLKNGEEFSLHSGQYRIIYTLDRSRRRIEILDIGKHDEAYQRLRKRQN